MLYFAYASNMNHAQMKERCPGGRFLRSVVLQRHRFVYDGYSVSRQGATANIVKSEVDRVRGALFEITEKDRLALDSYEGYPKDYDRKIVDVNDAEGNAYAAVTYFRPVRALGKPHPDYEKVILVGARDCKLPEQYIDRYLRVIRL
ncbi:MAG: gamma-glutamylcyclotransferase family protein [Candidatus Aminicenantales bacterium]